MSLCYFRTCSDRSQDVMVEQDVTPSHSPHTSISNQSPSAWLPQSLSRTYLLSLSVLSLLLGVCCLALVAYSQTHDGIANAGSSGGFKFNQRFLPTLVAVLYTLLWAPVVVDVVRTEPWALLSLPAGSKAADSLLQKDKLWWTHLSEAIRNRKRPGGVRWPLFIAVLASMVSSIAINPLSAGLFDTSDFLTSTDRRFNGVSGPDSKLQGSQIGDVTYLRTVTNLLLNVSTSAWTTNQYAVAPFWPAKLDKGSMSASLAQTPQHWQATRDIVSLEMDCKPFTSMRNLTGETGYLSGELVTDDGCAIKTALDDESAAYWAEVNVSILTCFQYYRLILSIRTAHRPLLIDALIKDTESTSTFCHETAPQIPSFGRLIKVNSTTTQVRHVKRITSRHKYQ